MWEMGDGEVQGRAVFWGQQGCGSHEFLHNEEAISAIHSPKENMELQVPPQSSELWLF